MQSFMNAQRQHIIAMVDVFSNACKLAATKDDGIISKEESKQIKQIETAVERFKTDLSRIK